MLISHPDGRPSTCIWVLGHGYFLSAIFDAAPKKKQRANLQPLRLVLLRLLRGDRCLLFLRLSRVRPYSKKQGDDRCGICLAPMRFVFHKNFANVRERVGANGESFGTVVVYFVEVHNRFVGRYCCGGRSGLRTRFTIGYKSQNKKNLRKYHKNNNKMQRVNKNNYKTSKNKIKKS